MTKDILSGGVIIAVAGAYYLGTRQILHSRLEDNVGADGLPLILSGLLAALGLLLIVRSLLTSRAKVSVNAGDPGEYHAPLPRALGLLAIAAGYALVAPIIGYLPAITLLIAAVAVYEGMRPSWILLVTAIGGAIGFWLLFVWLLGVEQPSSMFF
jgi:putative tricarboxylic transport membrane protein